MQSLNGNQQLQEQYSPERQWIIIHSRGKGPLDVEN